MQYIPVDMQGDAVDPQYGHDHHVGCWLIRNGPETNRNLHTELTLLEYNRTSNSELFLIN